MKIPECAGDGSCEKKSGGKNIPPASERRVGGEWFGGQNQFFAGSHGWCGEFLLILSPCLSVTLVSLKINVVTRRKLTFPTHTLPVFVWLRSQLRSYFGDKYLKS